MMSSVLIHGTLAAAIAYQFARGVGVPPLATPKLALITVRFVSPVASIAQAIPAPRLDRPRAAIDHASLRDSGIAIPLRTAALRPVTGIIGAGLGPSTVSSTAASLASVAPSGGIRSDYEETLRAHLRRYFVYPDGARADRLSGTVFLRLIVSRDGTVESAWIERSSGHESLDASALDLVHRAQPLPTLPAEYPDKQEIALPLEFAPPKIVLGGS